MTAKQAEVWSLYASGHKVTDIALSVGRSKSTVSTMIKGIKARMSRPVERETRACEHSPSCFTCPLRDCAIKSTYAPSVNALPGEVDRV